MCELLVGLGEVDLVGINDSGGCAPLEVVIRCRKPLRCAKAVVGRCGRRAIGVWCWWTFLRSAGRFAAVAEAPLAVPES